MGFSEKDPALSLRSLATHIMIGNNLSPHHGRRFHMDAAGPSLAAITRVHLKNKDIQSAIGRKFNGNPNDTTTFITALDTLLDRTDLGPYARGTVSVLVSQYAVPQ